MNETLTQRAQQRAQEWLKAPYDIATQERVALLLETGGDELVEAFHTDLEFGTGGLRGIMGDGSNRMNEYTVAQATQGFANYLRTAFGSGEHAVAIAYDCRKNSRFFTDVAADVFAANGFVVHVFEALRPTPILSFAVRELKCVGGIVITASHNPPKYNGYKVYWCDGGQVTAPHDQGITDEVRRLPGYSAVKRNGNPALIRPIGRNLDETYLERVQAQVLEPLAIAAQRAMPLVYTSLHGTGITLLPEALALIGFENVQVVARQAEPNGNFPTVKSPNPEEGAALAMALEEAAACGAEVVMGTDPDCDRVGVAVRTREGAYTLLNGNETGALLVWYQLSRLQAQKRLPTNGFVGKTIVTTELIRNIAAGFDVPCYDTLTGFKHLARLIADREPQERFITGGEESYGYMIGDFVRDKDGIAAACMIAEMVAWCKHEGLTVLELLERIHSTFGLYRESLVSMEKEGLEGSQAIQTMMEGFRNNPPSHLAGSAVVAIRDYREQVRRNLVSNELTPIHLPKSNVIQFELADLSLVTARPSGTEPKIKFYFSVVKQVQGDYFALRADADRRLNELQTALLATDEDQGTT
jgi:phosphoglucomutase